MMLWLVFTFGTVQVALADQMQLQVLIQQSAQQLEELRELVESGNENAESIRKARQVAERLIEGIERDLKPFEDIRPYQQALLEIQVAENSKRTFMDVDNLKALEADTLAMREGLKKFQMNSVKANWADLSGQKQALQEIEVAGLGYLPKLQAQLSLQQWQTQTRLSAQLTELIAALNAVREELRVERQAKEKEAAASESFFDGLVQSFQLPLENPDMSGSR